MSQSLLESQTAADERVTSTTRWLAERTPRRSFLGKVGRGLVASSVGGAAALSLFAETAYAGNCGCNGNVSVSCGCLTGTNLCPSDTCECGCWQTCNQVLCPGCLQNVNWCDCCNTSAKSSDCVPSCESRPKNCFPKEWSGGCSSGYTIRCRKYRCGSGGIVCC